MTQVHSIALWLMAILIILVIYAIIREYKMIKAREEERKRRKDIEEYFREYAKSVAEMKKRRQDGGN